MYAHAALWIDAKGRLCEEAPAQGLKIAPTKGDEIAPEFVVKYGLSEEKGKIVQKQQDKPENKAVETPPNKGRSGLSITRSSRREKKTVKKEESE